MTQCGAVTDGDTILIECFSVSSSRLAELLPGYFLIPLLPVKT
ncbi:MAG: hypothetical protein ACJA2P_001218 [Rhodoferax sp.]|jgi:hypothetical protein